jgi:hypothetical protein
MTAFLSPSS